MSNKVLSGLTAAAMIGGALLTAQASPASALMLTGPSVAGAASSGVEQVYYRAVGVYHGGVYRGGVRRGGVYRGGYGYHPYGYGAAAAVGAAALGAAALGAAVVAPRCWINNYGVQVCN